MDAVLLNSGYFRLVGSHNDRMPLSLCYLSTLLDHAGVDHVVFNSEFTGAKTYWSWQHLFDAFHLLKLAIDGDSPVFRQVAEQVVDFAPEVVVLGCGDPLLASVGLGNPHAAVQQAKVLRLAGVRHLYFFGPYATLDPQRWLAEGVFDGILTGPPGPRIVEVVRSRPKGIVALGTMPLDILPSIDRLEPRGQRCDVVLGSIGCAWRCSFCLTPRIEGAFRYFSAPTVAQDVVRRPPGRLYFGDMVFAVNASRLRALADELERSDVRREFICENRADVLDDERCAIMRRMGVTATKIGIESIGRTHLRAMNKKLTIPGMERAIERLRRHDIQVILYLMLGGPGASEESTHATFEWARNQDPDYVVVSTWSDEDVGRGHTFKYDAHFSPECLLKYNISADWLERYLTLQRNRHVSKLDNVIF